MMQLSRRQIVGLAIALVALILFTVLLAPRSGGNSRQRGSTYSRSPDGYGAWFAYMEQQGTAIERWRKPFSVLTEPTSREAQKYIPKEGPSPVPTTPITLIQISNGIDRIYPADNSWLEAGNVQVLLGVSPRVTDAPFTSDVPSRFGRIRIETSRRQSSQSLVKDSDSPEPEILRDSYGAIVWQRTVGKGRVIFAATPYLAANAYQDFQGNYELLADVVKASGQPIWVDEFLHGYEDPAIATKAGEAAARPDLLTYLWNTPLSLLTIQLLLLLGVLIWGQNRRFGAPQPVLPPSVDNSEAYIQAMAGVLHQAECSPFVLETVGKAEQLVIQRALGLGADPLTLERLALAWEQQTGRSPTELHQLLKHASGDRGLNDVELQNWINTMQMIRSHLP